MHNSLRRAFFCLTTLSNLSILSSCGGSCCDLLSRLGDWLSLFLPLLMKIWSDRLITEHSWKFWDFEELLFPQCGIPQCGKQQIFLRNIWSYFKNLVKLNDYTTILQQHVVVCHEQKRHTESKQRKVTASTNRTASCTQITEKTTTWECLRMDSESTSANQLQQVSCRLTLSWNFSNTY